VVKGFRQFLLRGNVVDLAVAVVIGGAFGAVVTKLVADLLTPFIAAVVGRPSFGDLTFTVHHSQFRYGDFLNAVVSFVSMAAAIYLLVVRPMDMIQARRSAPPAGPTTRSCPECLSSIPSKATRCAFCTATVPPAA
jgi:large conductance mechanosensitive channel